MWVMTMEVLKTEMGDISETLVAWTDKVEKFKDWWIVPNRVVLCAR